MKEGYYLSRLYNKMLKYENGVFTLINGNNTGVEFMINSMDDYNWFFLCGLDQKASTETLAKIKLLNK